MKIKTNELTGAALDWAVAKCEGHSEFRLSGKEFGPYHTFADLKLTYSTNWSQGGPIIEREKIDIAYENSQWFAYESEGDCCDPNIGPTPLIAAMRCYCVSKLGDTIDIPEELT
jgi:hypothetical protein